LDSEICIYMSWLPLTLLTEIMQPLPGKQIMETARPLRIIMQFYDHY